MKDPKWQKPSELEHTELPSSVKKWLLNEESLTARLIKKSSGSFYVNVLRQEWTLPQISESEMLSIPSNQKCLIREVLLHCHDEPWVYARTIMPKDSLVDELDHLKNFDDKPLGHLLFTTPGATRTPFEIAKLTDKNFPKYVSNYIHRFLDETKRDNNAFHWGRRSKFTVYNKNLLINEIFLPKFIP